MALTQTQVSELYVAIFNRASETSGNQFWQAYTSTAVAASDMLATDDAIAYFGTSLDSNQAFIEHIYANTLNKTVAQDPDGIQFWVDALDNGASRGSVVADLVASINSYAPGGANYDATDLVTVAAYNQFANRVAVSDYTAENFDFTAESNPEFDYKTVLGFDGDLTVTDDSATVTSAQASVDGLQLSGGAGDTFVLTTGLDVITGTDGDDTIIGVKDTNGSGDVTFSLGDVIDGGAGIDTLTVAVDDDTLSLTGKTISNVENLNVMVSDDDFDTLNINNVDFTTVTVDYAGTDHNDDVYINKIDGQATLVIDNVSMYNSYTFYRNDDGIYDDSEGAVSVTNTLQNWTENGDYSYFYGYEYFSAASTINHTLNVLNMDAGSEGVWIYDYIDSEVDGVVVNSTINVDNVTTDGTEYNDVYVYGSNSTGESTYNFTVNITDSDDIYTYFEAADSGDSDTIVYNVSNHTNENSQSELWSEEIETVTVNITGDSEFQWLGDGQGQGNAKTVTINADADLTVGDYVDFSTNVGDVTLTITGVGNVDIADTRLGDGGADDVVTIDASALTGDLTLEDSFGYAASITSGTGNDSITVNSDETAVSTDEGDDTVDTTGYNFGTDDDSAKLDGGAGTDTLVLNEGTYLDADSAANISNFEILDVTGAAGGDTFDMSLESDLTAVVATGALTANVTIDNAAAGTTVSLTATDSTDTTVADLVYVLEDATGDSDSVEVTLNASDTETAGTDFDGQLIVSGLTVDGIESVSIISNATTTDVDGSDVALATEGYTNTITSLNADAAETLTLSGNTSVTITTLADTALTTVDASGLSGALTIDLSGQAAAVTVTTSDDADVIIGSDYDDVISVGNGGNTVTGGLGADTITLGDGADGLVDIDTIIYTAVEESQGVTVDTIEGFQAAVQSTTDTTSDDVVDETDILNDVINLNAITAGTGAYLGEAAGYGAVLTSLSGGATAEAVFDTSTSTLYIDVDGSGTLDDADMAIQLNGVTSLTDVDNFVW